MNIFRVPFLMERLVPDSMTGTPATTYLADLKSVSNPHATMLQIILQSLIQGDIDGEVHHRQRCLCGS
jgi:hypothetical protein